MREFQSSWNLGSAGGLLGGNIIDAYHASAAKSWRILEPMIKDIVLPAGRNIARNSIGSRNRRQTRQDFRP